MSFDPHALLADASLRDYLKPASATTMDWMHNFLVNGVANLEFHLFLEKAKSELGLRYVDLHNFVVAAWRWPQWQSTHKVFCASLA